MEQAQKSCMAVGIFAVLTKSGIDFGGVAKWLLLTVLLRVLKMRLRIACELRSSAKRIRRAARLYASAR
jgi:hypothetical protein